MKPRTRNKDFKKLLKEADNELFAEKQSHYWGTSLDKGEDRSIRIKF